MKYGEMKERKLNLKRKKKKQLYANQIKKGRENCSGTGTYECTSNHQEEKIWKLEGAPNDLHAQQLINKSIKDPYHGKQRDPSK